MYQMTIKKNNKMRNIKIKHNRAFNVKYLSPTDFRGSRVKITDLRHNKSIIISFDYALTGIKEMALSELLKLGIKINSFSYNEKTYEYTLNSYDFATQIK